MKRQFYLNEEAMDGLTITETPPANSFIRLGGILYAVTRNEYDYDEELIKIYIVENEEFGEK